MLLKIAHHQTISTPHFYIVLASSKFSYNYATQSVTMVNVANWNYDQIYLICTLAAQLDQAAILTLYSPPQPHPEFQLNKSYRLSVSTLETQALSP